MAKKPHQKPRDPNADPDDRGIIDPGMAVALAALENEAAPAAADKEQPPVEAPKKDDLAFFVEQGRQEIARGIEAISKFVSESGEDRIEKHSSDLKNLKKQLQEILTGVNYIGGALEKTKNLEKLNSRLLQFERRVKDIRANFRKIKDSVKKMSAEEVLRAKTEISPEQPKPDKADKSVETEPAKPEKEKPSEPPRPAPVEKPEAIEQNIISQEKLRLLVALLDKTDNEDMGRWADSLRVGLPPADVESEELAGKRIIATKDKEYFAKTMDKVKRHMGLILSDSSAERISAIRKQAGEEETADVYLEIASVLGMEKNNEIDKELSKKIDDLKNKANKLYGQAVNFVRKMDADRENGFDDRFVEKAAAKLFGRYRSKANSLSGEILYLSGNLDKIKTDKDFVKIEEEYIEKIAAREKELDKMMNDYNKGLVPGEKPKYEIIKPKKWGNTDKLLGELDTEVTAKEPLPRPPKRATAKPPSAEESWIKIMATETVPDKDGEARKAVEKAMAEGSLDDEVPAVIKSEEGDLGVAEGIGFERVETAEEKAKKKREKMTAGNLPIEEAPIIAPKSETIDFSATARSLPPQASKAEKIDKEMEESIEAIRERPAYAEEPPEAEPAKKDKKPWWRRLAGKSVDVGKALRDDPEMRLSVEKCAVDVTYKTTASIFGVKFATDLIGAIPGMINEKWGFGDIHKYNVSDKKMRAEKKEIVAMFEGLVEKSKRPEVFGLRDRTADIETAVQSLREKINQSEHLKQEDRETLLNALIKVQEEFENTADAAEEARNKRAKELLDTFLQNKVSGWGIAKDALNTALTASGLSMVRGVAYAGTAAAERMQKAAAEFNKKRESAKAGGVEFAESKLKYILKDLTVNAAVETVRALSGKGAKEGEAGKAKKTTDFIKAAGAVARIVGIEYLALSDNVSTAGAIDALIANVQEHGITAAVQENFLHNFERATLHAFSGDEHVATAVPAVGHTPEVPHEVTSAPAVNPDQAEMKSFGLDSAGLDKSTITETATNLRYLKEMGLSNDAIRSLAADGISQQELVSVDNFVKATGGNSMVLSAFSRSIEAGHSPDEVYNSMLVHKGDGIERIIQRQLNFDPKKFGFEGDLNDAAAVHKWAGHEASVIAQKQGLDEKYFIFKPNKDQFLILDKDGSFTPIGGELHDESEIIAARAREAATAAAEAGKPPVELPIHPGVLGANISRSPIGAAYDALHGDMSGHAEAASEAHVGTEHVPAETGGPVFSDAADQQKYNQLMAEQQFGSAMEFYMNEKEAGHVTSGPVKIESAGDSGHFAETGKTVVAATEAQTDGGATIEHPASASEEPAIAGGEEPGEMTGTETIKDIRGPHESVKVIYDDGGKVEDMKMSDLDGPTALLKQAKDRLVNPGVILPKNPIIADRLLIKFAITDKAYQLLLKQGLTEEAQFLKERILSDMHGLTHAVSHPPEKELFTSDVLNRYGLQPGMSQYGGAHSETLAQAPVGAGAAEHAASAAEAPVVLTPEAHVGAEPLNEFSDSHGDNIKFEHDASGNVVDVKMSAGGGASLKETGEAILNKSVKFTESRPAQGKILVIGVEDRIYQHMVEKGLSNTPEAVALKGKIIDEMRSISRDLTGDKSKLFNQETIARYDLGESEAPEIEQMQQVGSDLLPKEK